METSRRSFLKLLGLGSAVTTAAVTLPEAVLAEEPKVRRYWDFGAAWHRAERRRFAEIDIETGLVRMPDGSVRRLYTQQELYVLGYEWSADDAHVTAASQLFNVSREKVTPQMRHQAKLITFGSCYSYGANYLFQAQHVDGVELITRTRAEFEKLFLKRS